MKLPNGELSKLKAQEQLYMKRKESLKLRLQHIKDLIKLNDDKILKTRKQIRKIVYND